MASKKNRKKRIGLLLSVVLVVLLLGGTAVYLLLFRKTDDGNGKAMLGDKDSLMITAADYGTLLDAPAEIGEHKKVAENQNFAMYLYEPTMSIKLFAKANGAVLSSTLDEADDDGSINRVWKATMQSGVNVTAIRGTRDTYTVNLASGDNRVSYTYLDNGFLADLYFEDHGFGFQVKVVLDGDSLLTTVPQESIVEEMENNYIGTIALFPFLGYTWMDAQDGYMLVPDGNGALIYLDDKDGRYSSGFSQMIYGRDLGFDDSLSFSMWDDYVAVTEPQTVLAPIYGMAHVEDEIAYLAVVEKGEERASIEAQPNGVMINYNRCYAKFYVRQLYVQPLNKSNSGTMIAVESNRTNNDLQVRFLLLSKEAADYTGMAVAYRDYLRENGLLQTKNTEYRSRVDFLGSDNEEWLVFHSAVPVTTTEHIAAIFEQLQDAGVESLLTVYKGWQKGGINSIPVQKYKAASEIGGTNALTELIGSAAEQDYQLYLYVNALEANPEEVNTTFNTVKKINKRRLEVSTYFKVYETMNYLVPAKAESILNSLLSSMQKKGVQNVALTGITNELFSYTFNGNTYSRRDTQEVFYRMVNGANESANLILESPCAYLWGETGVFLDMPLESSHYMYLDEEIPFLSIVLKGSVPMYSDYVNFEANKNEFFLKMVEAGVYPSFYLTYEDSSKLLQTNSANLYSTLYTTYIDAVVEYDAALRALAEQLEDAVIIRHEKLENGVTVVAYSNGATVYVNYTETPQTVDGLTIDGMSYKVGGV